MKLWLFALSSITLSLSAEERPVPTPELCKEMFDYGTKKLTVIRENIKKQKDIDSEFSEIENLIEKYPTCLSYQKLEIKDKEITLFRKHTYGYDRSFNLDQEKCTEYTVDTTHMPKNNNQGPLSWCFGFAAADLVSFYEKKRLSAYDISLHYHLEDNPLPDQGSTPSSETGGDIALAVFYALQNKKGVCLEDDFKYKDHQWEKLSSMIENLVKKNLKLKDLLCDNAFNELDTLKGLSAEVITILDKLSPTKRASALMDIQCENRHRPSDLYNISRMIRGKEKDSQEKLVEQIDKFLAKGEPISIAYSAGLLYKGVNFTGRVNHGSSVIGRKFNPASGQCEYLIKNSWGESDCQLTSSIKCEKGNYWVPRTSLKNNLEHIVFMEKKAN